MAVFFSQRIRCQEELPKYKAEKLAEDRASTGPPRAEGVEQQEQVGVARVPAHTVVDEDAVVVHAVHAWGAAKPDQGGPWPGNHGRLLLSL